MMQMAEADMSVTTSVVTETVVMDDHSQMKDQIQDACNDALIKALEDVNKRHAADRQQLVDGQTRMLADKEAHIDRLIQEKRDMEDLHQAAMTKRVAELNAEFDLKRDEWKTHTETHTANMTKLREAHHVEISEKITEIDRLHCEAHTREVKFAAERAMYESSMTSLKMEQKQALSAAEQGASDSLAVEVASQQKMIFTLKSQLSRQTQLLLKLDAQYKQRIDGFLGLFLQHMKETGVNMWSEISVQAHCDAMASLEVVGEDTTEVEMGASSFVAGSMSGSLSARGMSAGGMMKSASGQTLQLPSGMIGGMSVVMSEGILTPRGLRTPNGSRSLSGLSVSEAEKITMQVAAKKGLLQESMQSPAIVQ